jgi:hypothetical protein
MKVNEDNLKTITPQDRKRLGINKSTLWYMQKHIKEGKKVKMYRKIINRFRHRRFIDAN